MNKIIKTISAAAVALLLTSCLDLEPKDQMADTNMWATSSDFQLFANRFYDWFPSIQSMYNGDKESDFMVDKSGFNTISNGTNAVPASDGTYGGCYNHIRRCNILIERADKYSGTREDIAKPEGEAYFFRAYSYYTLLTRYGDAIIVTTPIDVDDPAMQAKRNDRSEVIKLILEDLDKAAELLPSTTDVENGYVGKEAALAFKARAALFEGTWQKFRGNEAAAKPLLDQAAQAAKAVIDSKKFQLFSSSALGTESYKYLFILEDTKCNPAGLTKSANKEYIIKRCYDMTNKQIGDNVTVGVLNNAQLMSAKVADQYLCSDGLPIDKSPMFQGYANADSEWQNRDNRMYNTLMKPHGKYWNGTNPNYFRDFTDADANRAQYADYMPGSGTGYFPQKWACERRVTSTEESYDMPILRYAEVLLAYAEAVFERDGKISDEDLDMSLNLVRRRVNPAMPKLSNAFVSANGLDMRTEIRRERSVEFVSEGFRLDDLKRWKTAEVEMPMDFAGVHVDGTEYGRRNFPALRKDAQGRVVWETGRKWAERNYLLPLPTDQLQLNPNLGQNPGW